MSNDSKKPSTVRRWLVRLGVLAILLLAGVAGFVWYAASAAGDIPSFYSRERLSDQARLDALASVERKFLNFQGGLSESSATTETDTKAEPEPVSVRFNADEIDAYFEKWLDDNGYREPMAKHLADPRLVIHDGRIVLAGKSNINGFGDVIVSVRFLPSIGDNGRARLILEDVAAGTFTLPEAAVTAMRQKSVDALGEADPTVREDVAIDEDGMANDAAVALAIDGQLRRLLASEPVEDMILFPPVIGRGNVAARVVELVIEEDKLRLDVLPLSREEREQLVEELRRPPEKLEVAVVDDDAAA